MNKIVFLDIDGTLYCDGIGIPESAQKAVAELMDKGCKVVLCTGRAYGMVPESYMEQGFHGMIAAAGAHVICEGRELCNPVRISKRSLITDKTAGSGLFWKASKEVTMTRIIRMIYI